MEFRHRPVLLSESIEALCIRPDGIYVDGTVGGGGHSYEICRRLSNEGRLIGLDRDGAAIEAASARLAEFGSKATIVRCNFADMKEELSKLGISSVDGVILDLGVSSYQLDDADRGFTYREDVPLDMRMDRRQSFSAYNVVNEYSREDLQRVIRDYGEDKFAANIARHIVRARADHNIETTGELIQIIKAAVPARVRAEGGHPAKRTFQAIRIEVNNELGILQQSLEDILDLLSDGGRVCVITFHSLEDRIVKNTFRTAQDPCICPKEFPVCVCGRKSKGRVVTRRPIVPSEEEREENPRSKSAKLRVFEKRSEA